MTPRKRAPKQRNLTHDQRVERAHASFKNLWRTAVAKPERPRKEAPTNDTR